MTEIGRNEWVQCVDASNSHGLLQEGAVYFVDRIEPAYNPETDEIIGRCLVLLTVCDDVAFRPSRFKPLGFRRPAENLAKAAYA